MRVRLYKKTKDNLSYFQILSNDGQAVLNSQGYADKDDRNNGVRSVVENADNPARYERMTSAEGKNYFILKAGNGQEIARSVEFDDAASMEAAISNAIANIHSLSGMEDGDAQPREATAPAVDTNPYDGNRGDDNYRPLAFYQERIKGVENGFDSFATNEGKFYFTLNQGGKIQLLSETYNSADGRNNGASAVTRNLPNPDRYQRQVHPNGKHYFNLLAGNNQQITTSVWFDSEADMNAAISALQRGLFGGTEEIVLKTAGVGATDNIEGMAGYRAAVDIADAPPPKEREPKEKKKRTSKEAKPKSADEKVYLKNGTYLFNDVTWQTMRSANGKHYFSFRTAEGKALMLSSNVQGFATEEEVDAVVKKVIDLGPYEGNFHGKQTTNGKYYFYLNDTEGKPVAKSFFYDTAEEMQDAIGLLIGRTRVAAAAAPAAIATTSGIHDDYLACERYSGTSEFHSFFNGDDENWYFGYNGADGKTLLRSEGYKSEKARENSIESVIKNAPLDERWVTGNDEEGYYYALRAGNNQEIARSCYFADEAGMLAGWAAAKEAFTPKVEKAAEPAPRIVDDYLPCEAYVGMEGYHTFEHEGEYYFSYNDIAGNVILRSEGYKSIAARDNGIESVKKNSPIEERWVKKQNEDGLWYFSLLAGNKQEIARTCYHEEAALFGLLRSAVGPLYTPPPPPRAPEPVAAPAPIIIDDYLPCEAYAGATDDDGFRRFMHKGEFYFAYLDKNNEVILRSEAYKSVGARDNGIQSVKKNAPIEERWVKETTDDGKHYYSLKAGNKQEIARSCYKENAGALISGWGIFGAAAALAAAAAVVPAVAKAATPPPPPPVVEKPKAVVPPPPPAPVAAAVAAASSGGFKWWWLLVPLLLLLMFLLFRGCDGCNKTTAVAPSVEEPTAAVTPPEDTTTAKPAPPAEPAAPVCACSGNAYSDMNIPSGATPKQLTRLGTNPEFGNSHGLSGKGFFDKLTRHYKRSDVDKQYLDELFKALGYTNGFADAKAEMFSEVTIPQGTSGNMGYSKLHKTLYATVPDNEHDRLAFNIKGATGCDFHFMKTCGNHFFFCPN